MKNISEDNLISVLQDNYELMQHLEADGKNINEVIKKDREETAYYIIDNFGLTSFESYGIDAFIYMVDLVASLENTPTNLEYKNKYKKLLEENKPNPDNNNAGYIALFNGCYRDLVKSMEN